MKNLNKKNILNQVYGGNCEVKDSKFDEFKKELNDLLSTTALGMGDGANSMSVKMNELLDKYK